jgi:hypothetical protein
MTEAVERCLGDPMVHHISSFRVKWDKKGARGGERDP